MYFFFPRAITRRNVGLNYIPENVLCETKLKNVSVQIAVLFCKIQTLEFPICIILIHIILKVIIIYVNSELRHCSYC